MQNKYQKIGILSISLLIIFNILLPYTSINHSLISDICKIISFFTLTITSYYLGTYTKNNKINYKNIILIIILANIISLLINPNKNILELYSTTSILLCLLIWSKIDIKNNKLFIVLFFILSLLTGFIENINNNFSINYLINLLPFYLLGHHFEYEIKISKKVKQIVGLIGIIIIIIGVIFLLNKFYISQDILLLNPFITKKHLVFRLGYYIISILMIICLNLLFTNDKSKLNINNIDLIIITPFIQIIFNYIINTKYYNNLYILYAIIITIGLILLVKYISISKILEKINYKNIGITLTTILLIITICLNKISFEVNKYPIYKELTTEEKEQIEKSVSISFVGDLILLENQVKAAYQNGSYNFDEMFKYTKDYLSSSDLSIGVLEGPVANTEYTIGNFDDNVNLHLNFPLSFAESIKNNGIDLVTISNNHILDQGINGVNDTIDNLNKINLDYIGSTKERYKIINTKGLKIGVLAYTYGSNYYTEDEMIKNDITPLIVDPSSKNYNKIKEQVINDFNNLKKENIDIIIVIPHMGTQFSHEIDVMQNTWNKIFIDNGATIIFGDHSHAVQPITYDKDSIIVNSPGNYANQYNEYDGDATSIIEVYIDPTTKKVTNTAVIPMYTYGNRSGNFTALPIYSIMHNEELFNSISDYEMKRITEVHKIITKTMLNQELDIDDIEYKYYLTKDGYKRTSISPLDITEYQENQLVNLLANSKDICFVGDSITEGTMNGGYGWYLPLTANYNKQIKTAAHGSYTTTMLLNNKEKEIIDCSSSLNVIAIGTNDIRYRNNVSALTKEKYIENIDKIINLLKKNNPNSQFVLIAPFISTRSDTVSKVEGSTKQKLYDEYSEELKKHSNLNNYLFINPNQIIINTLNTTNNKFYMKDFIHPNRTNGIYMYSKAILDSIE